ncbi:MAG: porin [Saprospiraceae bacterium]|nr:porin [Flavobacteriaceae bacterium]MCB0687122.1 porin [Saprospiraceae bacterium]
MVTRLIGCIFAVMLIGVTAYSQEETTTPSLTISGSIDAYYRFNFQNANKIPATDNLTSFTNSQNSFELGMASVKFDYSKGKLGGVIDLGVGTRATEFSYAESGALSALKQGYVTYSPSDAVTFSMGKWATHVGYELLDPQLNRNYSMSYMFSYGPFSHTGLKADFSLGNGFGAMLGIANPTDNVSASFAKKNVLAQISQSGDVVSAYLNYVGGKDLGDNSVNQVGLTATVAISDKFSIGYDGTVKSVKPEGASSASWWGSAIYLNVDPSDMFGFTIRGEYFDDKNGAAGIGTSLFDATLSLDIKPAEGILIIPEIRLDSAKDPIFYTHSEAPAPNGKSAASFVLAAIVSF